MRKHIKIISLVIFILCVGLSGYFIHKGFTHVLPQDMLRLSVQKWNEGQYTESIKWFVASYEDALDAGIRWIIVENFYLRQISDLSNEKNFKEALETCARAIRVLNGHDDEGGLSYTCIVLEEQIKNK